MAENGKQTVLFLCTGNYYRSRFAEHFFNHVAVREGLAWQADSRGLDVKEGRNPGPMAWHRHPPAPSFSSGRNRGRPAVCRPDRGIEGS